MPFKSYVYLDHNATTIMRPEVAKKMSNISGLPYNASAMHFAGQEAKKLLSSVRQAIMQSTHATAGERVLFTSGGTESNNLVLQSDWDYIFCSATEHDSVYKGPITSEIPVSKDGIVDVDALVELLEHRGTAGARTLVSVHWANNETGVIQPIGDIAEIARRYGAFIHVDGVQAFGKIPLSFIDFGIDFLSLSAHKIGGPQGVGALVLGPKTQLNPLYYGGGQEYGIRPGTENIAGIVGFGEAIEKIDFKTFEKLKVLHQILEKDLSSFAKAYGVDVVIVGENAPRLPNTTCLSLPGVSAQSQLIYFDLEKIGVSIGAACSSGVVKASRVLSRMGLSDEIVHSCIRISSGWGTCPSNLERFAEAWKALFLSQRTAKKC